VSGSLIIHETDPEFTKILWKDKITFKTNGRANQYSCVLLRTIQLCYWSDNNPYQVTEEDHNVPGLTVWVGIWAEGVTGPFSLNALQEGRVDELSCSNLYIVGVSIFM
jgi:hypothetical protein